MKANDESADATDIIIVFNHFSIFGNDLIVAGALYFPQRSGYILLSRFCSIHLCYWPTQQKSACVLQSESCCNIPRKLNSEPGWIIAFGVKRDGKKKEPLNPNRTSFGRQKAVKDYILMSGAGCMRENTCFEVINYSIITFGRNLVRLES